MLKGEQNNLKTNTSQMLLALKKLNFGVKYKTRIDEVSIKFRTNQSLHFKPYM